MQPFSGMKIKRFPELSGMLTGLEMSADGGDNNQGGGAGSTGSQSDQSSTSGTTATTTATGGQGQQGSGGGDDDFNREGGMNAIRALRQENKQFKELIRSLENRIDPELFAKTKAEQEALERRVQEQESQIQLRVREVEDSYSGKLRESSDLLTKTRSELDTLQRQIAARAFWEKGGGIPEDFEAFWTLRGDRSIRRDESGFFVADESGTPVLGEDGKRLDPIEWVKQLESDSLIAAHMRATAGSGSGSSGGRRIPSQGQDLQKMSKRELFSAFNDD